MIAYKKLIRARDNIPKEKQMQQKWLIVALCLIGIVSGLPIIIHWFREQRQKESDRFERLQKEANKRVGRWKVVSLKVITDYSALLQLRDETGTRETTLIITGAFELENIDGRHLSIGMIDPPTRPRSYVDFLELRPATFACVMTGQT